MTWNPVLLDSFFLAKHQKNDLERNCLELSRNFINFEFFWFFVFAKITEINIPFLPLATICSYTAGHLLKKNIEFPRHTSSFLDTSMKRLLIAASLTFSILCVGQDAFASLVINSLNTTTTVTFDSTLTGSNNGQFAGTGLDTVVTSGRLDSNSWRVLGMSDGASTFGGAHTTGDFNRGQSTGGVTTGGLYAFDRDSTAAVNRILGVQPGGSDFVTNASFTLRVQNNTGSTASHFKLAYDIWALNNEPRANSFNFAYSTDDITYTPFAGFDFTTPGTADVLGWQSTNRTGTFSQSVSNSSLLYLRWSSADVSGAGNRDEFGLDGIGFSFVPEPTSFLMFGTVVLAGLSRRRKK